MAGRAAAGPADAGRAVPCQPTGLSSGLGTACSLGPGQPGPADHRAVPCLVWAKITCFVSGHRASGSMDIYIGSGEETARGQGRGASSAHAVEDNII